MSYIILYIKVFILSRGKSDKTLGLEIITSLLKKRKGKRIDWEEYIESQALRTILESTKTYNTLAKQNGSYLLVDDLQVKHRIIRCLFIISSNGSRIPLTKNKFSKAFEKKKSASSISRSAIISALRDLIQPQINEFRINFKKELIKLSAGGDYNKLNKKLQCPITGKRLNNKNHIDHHPISFIELADNWLESVGFKAYTDLPVRKTKSGIVFKDQILEKSWIDYHNQKAQLRMTSAKGNLKKNSEGYRSKFKN